MAPLSLGICLDRVLITSSSANVIKINQSITKFYRAKKFSYGATEARAKRV